MKENSTDGESNNDDNLEVEKAMADKKCKEKLLELQAYIPALRHVMDNIDTADCEDTSLCRRRLEVVHSLIENPEKREKLAKYEQLLRLERILKNIALKLKLKKCPRVVSPPTQKSPRVDSPIPTPTQKSPPVDDEGSQSSIHKNKPGPSGHDGKKNKKSPVVTVVFDKPRSEKKVPIDKDSFLSKSNKQNKKGVSKNFRDFDDLFTPDPYVSKIRPGTSTDDRRSFKESGTHRPRFFPEETRPRGERFRHNQNTERRIDPDYDRSERCSGSDSEEYFRDSYTEKSYRFRQPYCQSKFRFTAPNENSGSRFRAPFRDERFRVPSCDDRFRAPMGEKFKEPSIERLRIPANEGYRAPFSNPPSRSPLNDDKFRIPSSNFRNTGSEETWVRFVTYNPEKAKPRFTDDEERYYEKPKNVYKNDKGESEVDSPTFRTVRVKKESSDSKSTKGNKESRLHERSSAVSSYSSLTKSNNESLLCSRSILENVDDLEMQKEDIEKKLKSNLNNRLKYMQAQRLLMASSTASKKSDASVGLNIEFEDKTREKHVTSEETSKQESDKFLDNVMSNLSTKFSFKRSFSSVNEQENKNKPELSVKTDEQNTLNPNNSEANQKEPVINSNVIKRPCLLSDEDRAEVMLKVKEILEKTKSLNSSSTNLNVQQQTHNDEPLRIEEEQISEKECVKSHTSVADICNSSNVQIPGLDGIVPPAFERIPSNPQENVLNQTKENCLVTKALKKDKLSQSSQENVNSDCNENITVQENCVINSMEGKISNESIEKPNLNLDPNLREDTNKTKHGQSLRSKLTGEISTLHKVGTPCGGALRGLVKRDKMMPSGQIASLKPGALYDLLNEDKPRLSTKTKSRPQVQSNSSSETLSTVNTSTDTLKTQVCPNENENSFSSIKANSPDEIISKLTENDLKRIINDNIGALPTPPNLQFLNNLPSRIQNEYSQNPNSSSPGVPWNNLDGTTYQQYINMSNINSLTPDNTCKSNMMYHQHGSNWANPHVNESRKNNAHIKDPRRESQLPSNVSLSSNHGIENGQNLYNPVPETVVSSFEKPNYSNSIYTRNTETLMGDKETSKDPFYLNSFMPSVTLQSDPYKSPCYDGSATPDPYRSDPYTMSLQDNSEKPGFLCNDSSEKLNAFSRPSMLCDPSAYGESHANFGRDILQRSPIVRTPPPITSRTPLLGPQPQPMPVPLPLPQERELYTNFSENKLSRYNDPRNMRRAPVTYAEWKSEQNKNELRNRYRWTRDTISRTQELQSSQYDTSYKKPQKDSDSILKLSSRDPRRKSIDDNLERKESLPSTVPKPEINNQDWSTRKFAKSSGIEQCGNNLHSTLTTEKNRDRPNQLDPRRREKTPPRGRPINRDRDNLYSSRGRGSCRGRSPSWLSDDVTNKHHHSDKNKDTYSSPLVQLYKNTPDPKTGLGYGFQKFRIPKKNKSSFDHTDKPLTKGSRVINDKKCFSESDSKSKNVSEKGLETLKGEIKQEICDSAEVVSVKTLANEESNKKEDDDFQDTNSDNCTQENIQVDTPDPEKISSVNKGKEDISQNNSSRKDCIIEDKVFSPTGRKEESPADENAPRRSTRLIKKQRGCSPKEELDVEQDKISASPNQPNDNRSQNEEAYNLLDKSEPKPSSDNGNNHMMKSACHLVNEEENSKTVDKSSIDKEKTDPVGNIAKHIIENTVSKNLSGVQMSVKDVKNDLSVETSLASKMPHERPNNNKEFKAITNSKSGKLPVMESSGIINETENSQYEPESESSETPQSAETLSMNALSQNTKESTTVPCDDVNTGPEIKIIKQVELLEDVIGIKLTPDKIRKMAEILNIQEAKEMRKDQQPQDCSSNDVKQEQEVLPDVNLDDSQNETSNALQLKNLDATENQSLGEDKPQQEIPFVSETDNGKEIVKSLETKKGEPQNLKDVGLTSTSQRPKRKYKNELDRLQDDISKYHDSEAIAAASGPRQCRLQKEKTKECQISSQNRPIVNKGVQKKYKDDEFYDLEEKSTKDGSVKSLDEVDDVEDSSMRDESDDEAKNQIKSGDSSLENENYQSDSSSDSLINLYNEKMKSKYHFILQEEAKGEPSGINIRYSTETESVSSSALNKNTESHRTISRDEDSLNKSRNKPQKNSKDNNISDHDAFAENFCATESESLNDEKHNKGIAHNILKYGLKKQRKKSFWSAGIIRRKTKSKRSSTSVSSSNEDDVDIPKTHMEEEEEFMVNEAPDINYYQEGDSKPTPCKLCPFYGKSIVTHYAITHPKDEVLISRMSPEAAEMAVKESGRFFSMGNDKRKEYSKMFECRVCFMKFHKFSSFFEHIALHTGEFRHECCRCGYRTSTRSGILKHYQTHNVKNSNVKSCRVLYKEPENKTFFCGYLCSLCNYFQISQKNVKRHVENVHDVQDLNRVIKINFSKVNFSEEDLNTEISDMTSSLVLLSSTSLRNNTEGISKAGETLIYTSETQKSKLVNSENCITPIKMEAESLNKKCLETGLEHLEEPCASETENQNKTLAYDSSDGNECAQQKEIVPLDHNVRESTEKEDSTFSDLKNNDKDINTSADNLSHRVFESPKGTPSSTVNIETTTVSDVSNEISEYDNENERHSPMVIQHDWFLSLCKSIAEINQQYLTSCADASITMRVENLKLRANCSNIVDEVKQRCASDTESDTPLDDFLNASLSFKIKKRNFSSPKLIDNSNNENVVVKEEEEQIPSRRHLPERTCKGNNTKMTHERDNETISDEEIDFEDFKEIKEFGDYENDWNDDIVIKEENLSEYKLYEDNNSESTIGSNHQSLPCLSLPLESVLSKHSNRKPLSIQDKFYSSSLPLNSNFSEFNYVMKQILQVTLKASEIKEVKVGGLEVLPNGTGVLFSCYVKIFNKECGYQTPDLETFGQHVNMSHHTAFWNGVCCSCLIHFVQDPNSHDKFSVNTQSRAFCHLVREHLTFTKKTTKLVTRENLIESDAPVSDDVNPPRLRVRRLSGDMLSGTENVLPQPTVEVTGPEEAGGATTASIQLSESDPSVSDVSKLTQQPEMKILGVKIPPNLAEANGSAKVFKPFNDGKGTAKTTYKMESTYKEMCSDTKLRHLYKCMGTLCSFTTVSLKDFARHFEYHKEIQVQKPDEGFWNVCAYCLIPYSTSKDLCIHVRKEHAICTMQCSLCFYRAKSIANVHFHHSVDHPTERFRVLLCNQTETNLPPFIERPFTDFVSAFRCSLKEGCSLFTYMLHTFITHIKTAHPQDLHCHLCGCDSINIKALLQHYCKLHGIGLYQCLFCTYGATTEHDIRLHLCYVHPSTDPKALQRTDNALKPNTGLTNRESIKRLMFYKDQDKLLGFVDHPPAAETIPESSPNQSEIANQEILPEASSSQACVRVDNNRSILQQTASALSVLQPPIRPTLVRVKNLVKGMAIPSSGVSLLKRNVDMRTSPVTNTSISKNDQNLSTSTLDSEKTVCAENSIISTASSPSGKKGDSSATESDCSTQESVKSSSPSVPSNYVADTNYFKCGNKGCSFEASTSAPLKTHLVICDQARQSQKLTCAFCNRVFKQVGSLVEHLRGHGPERYTCSICNFKASLVSRINSHMKTCHHVFVTNVVPVDPTKQDSEKDYFIVNGKEKRRGEKPGSKGKGKSEPKTKFSPEEIDDVPTAAIFQSALGCRVCSYETKVRSNLVRHILQHKSGTTVPQEEFVNPVPEKTEKMFDKMMNLAGSSHKKKSGPDNSNDEAAVECRYKYVWDQDRYKCHIRECGYRTLSETMLRNHISVIHKDETHYACPHCEGDDVSFIPIDQLSMHLKLHDSPVYKCAYCDFCSHIKRSIERHSEVLHPGEVVDVKAVRLTKPDQNLDQPAPKTFPSERSDEQGEEWLCCNFCIFRTKKKKMMLQHGVIEHKMNKPFKCSECGYESLTDQIFKDHFTTYHPDTDAQLIALFKKITEVKKPVLPPIPPLWKRDAKRLKLIRGIKLDEKGDAPPPVATAPTGIEGLDVLELKFGHFGKPDGINFTCPRCSASFTCKNRQEMKEHLFKDFEYNPVVCRICKVGSTQRTKVMKHINKVHNVDWDRISEHLDIATNEELESWVEKVLSRQQSLMNESPGGEDGEPPRKRRRSSVETPPPPNIEHSDSENVQASQESDLSPFPDDNEEHRVPEKRKRDKCPSRHRFGCEYCNVTTKYKHSITLHCKKVHPDLPPHVVTLEKVMEENTEAFICMFCNCTALNQNNMKYHWTNTHKNSGLNFLFRTTVFNTELEYECYWCKKRSDLESLEEHCRDDHSPEQRFLVSSVSVPKYKCSECTSVFKSLDMLRKHFPVAHPSKQFCYIVVSGQKSQSPYDPTSILISPPNTSVINYKCFNCAHSNAQYHLLVKHMHKHFVTYVCTECGNWFPSAIGHNNHRVSKHPLSTAKPKILEGSKTDIENAKKNIIVVLHNGLERKITEKEIAEAEKQLDDENADTYTYDEPLEVQLSPSSVKETARKSTGSPRSLLSPTLGPMRHKRNLFNIKTKKLNLSDTFVTIKSKNKIIKLPAEALRSIMDLDAGPAATSNMI